MPTVILRPSHDITLNHDTSSGSNGYSLVNESTADGDSTYISGKNSGNSYKAHRSSFSVSGAIPKTAVRVTGISVTINARHDGDSANNGYAKVRAKIAMTNGSGLSQESSEQNVTTSYANYSFSFSTSTLGLDATDVPSLENLFTVELVTNSKPKSTSYKNYSVRITQAYVTVTYEESSTPVYNCAAVNVDYTTVSVSNPSVLQGGECTFTATANTGCVFDGWFRDAACTDRVSSNATYSTTVYSDITLYAKSKRILRFKQNGSWTDVNRVWKKVNYSWVELSEQEIRDILSSNNIQVIM